MTKKHLFKISSFTTGFFSLLQSHIFASGTTGLPWEAPLQTMMLSLTGPVAFSVSLIAVAVSGCLLVFGGEMGDFARRMIMLVMVIGLLVGGGGFLATLFGVGGAVII